MGIDWITLRFDAVPQVYFCDVLTEIYPPEGLVARAIADNQIKVHTVAGVHPHLDVRAYYDSGITYVHTNPNRMPDGLAGLLDLLDGVFLPGWPDPSIRRIDLEAEIPVPLDYIRQAIRIPYKRSFSEIFVKRTPIRLDYGRDIRAIYIGRSPCVLRLYRPKTSGSGGQPVTRIEWQYRHDRCPVQVLSDISKLVELRPFDALQFTGQAEVFEWDEDPRTALRRWTWSRLSAEVGAQRAAQILNWSRNFSRTYGTTVPDLDGINDQLQNSYLAGVTRFLSGGAGGDPETK